MREAEGSSAVGISRVGIGGWGREAGKMCWAQLRTVMSARQSCIKVNGSFYKEVMCSEPSFNQLHLVTKGVTLC